MTRRSKGTVAASAIVIVVALTAALGVHALQAQQAAADTARLPVVEMERVIVFGERTSAAPTGSAAVARNATPAPR